jgi:3-oxoacyl-[acyl-carrier protein] reductase
VSSIIAFTGFSGLSVYAATKAGLQGFTGSLSRELGRRSITVNCVAPGFVATDMNAGMSETAFESVKRRAPLGLPEPADIASMVAYLLSPEAGKITGQSFVVDGGSTA